MGLPLTTPQERRWVSSTLLAMAVDTVGVLPVFFTGVMAPQIQASIGMGIQSLGYVFGAYFAAATLLSVPMGRLSDRAGPVRALQVGTVLHAISLIGMSQVHTAAMLMVFIGLAGVGTAITRQASSLLVARAVAPGRQGLAFGLRASAIPAAALLAGLSVPAIALTVGWRWGFVFAASLSLALLVLLPGSLPQAHRDGGQGEPEMAASLMTWAAVAAALSNIPAVSMGAFAALTAVRAGVAEGAAGLLIAFASTVGVASRIGVGYWSDRRSGSQLDIVIAMMALGAIAYALIAVGSPRLLWLAIPAAYATGWAHYGSFFLSIVRLNRRAPGAALGMVQGGAFSGSIIGPTALGFLANRYSFSVAWIAAGIAAFTAAVIVFYVERRVRNVSPSRGRTGDEC